MEMFPDESGGAFQSLNEAMLERTIASFEWHSQKTGCCYDVRAYPSPGGLSIYARDITRRKHAEQAVRESEKKFKTIFEGAGDAIFITDSEARIIEANKVTLQRLGYEREQLLQMTMEDIACSEDPGYVRERLEEILRDGFAVSSRAISASTGR